MSRAKATRTSGAKLRPGNAWRSGTTTAKDAWIAGPAAAVGRALGEIGEGARFTLLARHGDDERPAGEVSLNRALPPDADAALAFDPVGNSRPELHPTGLVHGVRAFAYRAGRRWRGAEAAR
ncbi:hypothetical protein ACFQS1_03115 [Paractinoplanes rhizophilus]|uniref:Uncharacterized protein n=1 Tax=Paractinoplanes rhizophilus TaxID=1416877 RepID=A0ABW2HJC1_9ACTN